MSRNRYSLKEEVAIEQLPQHCSSGIANLAVGTGPVALEDYETGSFDEMVGKWLELVEQAAAQGADHIVAVQFRHEPNMNLIPVLLRLYDRGICVSAVSADTHDFLLLIEKMDMQKLGQAKKHYTALMVNELSRQTRQSRK